MCGITGIVIRNGGQIDLERIKRMIGCLRHRGPDEFGVYLGPQAGLGHARLSIIDLNTGTQPVHNEDKSLWLVFNGEIYNFIELRSLLEAKGHSFYTKTDTEVIVHAYEEYGTDCLKHFNGQFAFAIWDANKRQLFLARDRVGIRPLFYHLEQGTFAFASEIKSLFTLPHIVREIDPIALDQIFTMWTTLPPRTAFKDVWQLPPGCFGIFSHEKGTLKVNPYWELPFNGVSGSQRSEADYCEELNQLLTESTRIRLRADVPVGAYLSGGLDSTIITSLINTINPSRLSTYSIRFSDQSYDESSFQKKVIDHLKVDHHEIHCTHSDIAKAFPHLIWHTETPLLRTAPTPLMLLSRLVRDNKMKVVLTGEGADEMLAGYNIFREASVRQFWSKYPESRFRPLLIQKLYPYLKPSNTKTRGYLSHFFKQGLTNTHLSYYSHLIRWRNTSRLKSYFDNGLREKIDTYDPLVEFEKTLGNRVDRWPLLHKAQFIEIKIFLSNYLLSSQGDRVSMANSVEGRYPFLDHNLIEFCCGLPPSLKLRGLREKYILKKTFSNVIPAEVVKRDKHPYRAPIFESFLGENAPEFVEELFSEKQVKEKGYFKADVVKKMIAKGKRFGSISEVEEMGLAGILSVQLLDDLFIRKFDTKIEDAKANQVTLFRQEGTTSVQ
jgi:asparagine synthase (glutamine-hydrolysing)